MQTTTTKYDFLDKARTDAQHLHSHIEQALNQGEAKLHGNLTQAGQQARTIAASLKAHAQDADAGLKAKLAEAAAHADAAAANAEKGRARPLLDEARKLSQRLSEAVAGIRSRAKSGA